VGTCGDHTPAALGAPPPATASLFALRHGLLPEERLAG
jgi:hypothetical protein